MGLHCALTDSCDKIPDVDPAIDTSILWSGRQDQNQTPSMRQSIHQ